MLAGIAPKKVCINPMDSVIQDTIAFKELILPLLLMEILEKNAQLVDTVALDLSSPKHAHLDITILALKNL